MRRLLLILLVSIRILSHLWLQLLWLTIRVLRCRLRLKLLWLLLEIWICQLHFLLLLLQRRLLTIRIQVLHLLRRLLTEEILDRLMCRSTVAVPLAWECLSTSDVSKWIAISQRWSHRLALGYLLLLQEWVVARHWRGRLRCCHIVSS